MSRKANLLSAQSEANRISSAFQAFPIDPFQIAEENEITVLSGDSGKPGISGCIVFANDGACIYFSKTIQNVGFQRFTIAHELGHYFIPGHPDEIIGAGGTHFSQADFGGVSPIEREADQFAAHLLMPTNLSKELLLTAPRGLGGITYLAETAITSVTSSAIRAVQIDPYPLAVIKSKNNSIQFSILTPSLRSFGFMRAHAKGCNLPDVQDPEESYLGDWFDTAPPGLAVRAETIILGAYGLLTVITPKSAVSDPYEDENEDDEAALEASWTPRFKGQR